MWPERTALRRPALLALRLVSNHLRPDPLGAADVRLNPLVLPQPRFLLPPKRLSDVKVTREGPSER